ncbi:hypothetical protein LB505_010735 [Fusarium chuoi]|nr:hypothetical protein LB505_010735 [Fusarium chuoi]
MSPLTMLSRRAAPSTSRSMMLSTVFLSSLARRSSRSFPARFQLRSMPDTLSTPRLLSTRPFTSLSFTVNRVFPRIAF